MPCDQAALGLPDRVLLDTSFAVDALLSEQRYHVACSTALVDLAMAEGTLVYSSLLEVELMEAIYKISLKERYGKGWEKKRPDGRARRRVAGIGREAMEAWEVIDGVLRGEQIDMSRVADRVPDLMHRYGLQSYDAVHVVTAFYTGTGAVYALDTDFARVPAKDLTVFTVSPKVSAMRKLRA